MQPFDGGALGSGRGSGVDAYGYGAADEYGYGGEGGAGYGGGSGEYPAGSGVEQGYGM